jgi:hypothetical protein
MQLTPDDKAVILNYLKDGQREMALQYVSRKFKTSHYDSQKLLEGIEREFGHELKGALPKKFDGVACSGCLSKILKVISVFLIIVSIGIFALGYFFIDLFGQNWNNRQIPVIVKDMVYSYSDSSYANIIYEFEKDGHIEEDTSSLEYNTSYTLIGDTVKVFAHDLGFGLDEETIKRLEERQQVFYYVGASVLTAALLFLAVSSIFKVRPLTKETAGRYAK